MIQNATALLLRKLRIDRKIFITGNELKDYCRTFELDYAYISRYYQPRGVFVRIFRGIFYVKSAEEMDMRHNKYNHLELVAKGLELKGVTDWYFGLYTALKLNEMTHEHFTTEEVVSGKILRTVPITIADHKFHFTKLKPKLTSFGIRKKGTRISSTSLKYSDPEKTILDFIHLWKYEGLSENRVKMAIREWTVNLDKKKLKRYAEKYPKTVRKISLEELS